MLCTVQEKQEKPFTFTQHVVRSCTEAKPGAIVLQACSYSPSPNLQPEQSIYKLQLYALRPTIRSYPQADNLFFASGDYALAESQRCGEKLHLSASVLMRILNMQKYSRNISDNVVRVVCPKIILFNAKNYRTKYFGHEIFVIYDSLIWTRSQESTKLNLFVY